MDNKNIFSTNLKRYMALKEVSRKDLAKALNISYFTVSDWVNGKKFPRMDKVEMLADYFGILKSDLIEEKTEEHRKTQKKNDTLTDIVLKLRSDDELLSLVDNITQLNPEQRASIMQIVSVMLKG